MVPLPYRHGTLERGRGSKCRGVCSGEADSRLNQAAVAQAAKCHRVSLRHRPTAVGDPSGLRNCPASLPRHHHEDGADLAVARYVQHDSPVLLITSQYDNRERPSARMRPPEILLFRRRPGAPASPVLPILPLSCDIIARIRENALRS